MGLGINAPQNTPEFSVLNRLKSRLKWHEVRQAVLAGNVANADTPGYKARDVLAPDSASRLTLQASLLGGLSRTSSRHIAATPAGQKIAEVRYMDSFEMTPERNAVVLEEEMMKITANQLDYQKVSTLYARTLGFLRAAMRS